MVANLKFIAPLVMAGAAAAAIATAPVAATQSFAVATGSTSSITIPASPGGEGCLYGTCGSGDASGGGGCTADGRCGHGGPWGGGGCVPGVGCFNWNQ